MVQHSGASGDRCVQLDDKLALLNKRLEEAEAFKGHFLSNIRNEINNPLTSILGMAGQIMNGEIPPESVGVYARMIHREAFNLDFQLNNICMAAELEAGEAVPYPTRIDVAGILSGICQDLEHLSQDKQSPVSITGADGAGFANDARMFHLIVVNLAANALTFCDDGTPVEIAVTSSPEGLELTVTNQGPPLSVEDRERIFDRFRQLETGPCKVHPGHGLGLSVVRALTELLGGDIEVSAPDISGWRVRISLPGMDLVEEALAHDANLILFDNLEQF